MICIFFSILSLKVVGNVFSKHKILHKKDSSLKILKNQDQFEDPQLLKRKVSVVRVTPIISPYFCGTQQMIQ